AAFSHHVPLDPLLRQFDYVFKLDIDVAFTARPDANPAHVMHAQQCSFAHARIDAESPSCQAGAHASLVAFGAAVNATPASAHRRWCQLPEYFYGNFVG